MCSQECRCLDILCVSSDRKFSRGFDQDELLTYFDTEIYVTTQQYFAFDLEDVFHETHPDPSNESVGYVSPQTPTAKTSRCLS